MSPAKVIFDLLLEVERLNAEADALREQNGRLLIAVRGYEIGPQSPFPLLSGDEVLRILHPRGWRR